VSIQKSAQLAADVDNYKTANARITKHAPVALINQDNLHVLQALHPPSLQRGCIKARTNTRSGGTRRKFRVTPSQVIKTLTHLNKGKATGINCDSLDLYINAARHINLSNPKDFEKANALAGFFNKVINGDVPSQFQTFIRQTYLVALEKEPDDKTKLRPLGVPSAIRRIAGILILNEYAPTFADYLLPYNYAIGVNGGIDLIIKTIQLATDKYIIDPENNGELPTRALVSLDIKNMFNAVSRERLREIISEKFPTLEAYADLIYDGAGETFVRLENGEWTVIPVTEGFSQGCPASPVFAALVLHDILSKIQPELQARAEQRKANGDPGDDKFGSIGFSIGYVDDVNAMLHHLDVDFFLKRFVELGKPLGAILNTDKTRIMTTASNVSLIERMKASADPELIQTGIQLTATISKYSTTQANSISVPVEVTDGLRVLGAPIGSRTFCQTFITKALGKAQTDANKLLTGLEDLQTTLRLYSMCTAQRITHLFAHDVYNTEISELPDHYWLWNSDMTDQFSTMTADLLANITNQSILPVHSQLISGISILQGGLGIQSPRCNAISTYMTTTKRCLQYVHQGVWLGFNKPRPLLPLAITTLYQDWEVSNNRSWEIFRKYLPTFNEISVHEPSSPHDYVFKASLNGSKDKMKEYGAKRIITKVLEDAQVTPEHVLRVLPSLLDKRTSMALMTMNRSNEANRIKNNTFKTALQRKLRLPILDSHQDFICKCGAKLDAFGDHSLGCKANHKGKASNGIRDEIAKIFQRILPIVKMIDSPTQIEKELHNIVPSLPQLKPFDLSIRLDHQLDTRCWRTPYTRIGFDVTLIHSTTESSSSASEAATYHETELRLRDGEKMKFARRTGGTNPLTKRTLSADEVIGEILDCNNAFIPIAVGPFGELGSIFRRFIERYHTLPLPTFSNERPNAKLAAQRAIIHRTPYDVFGKADIIWRETHGSQLFGGSYLSSLPSTWANQRLGLATCTHLANHINSSLTKVRHRSDGGQAGAFTDAPSSQDAADADWKFYGGELHYATHDDGNDGLDAVYATEDGMDPFSVEPVHHRVL
jgi:hypothetical protein